MNKWAGGETDRRTKLPRGLGWGRCSLRVISLAIAGLNPARSANLRDSIKASIPTRRRLLLVYSLGLCLVLLFFPLLVSGDGAEDYKISSHFWASEFRCKCGCSKLVVDQRLLMKLEQLRNALGNRAITITSGYRCPARNKAVGGVKNSYHLFGMAADIQVKDKTPHEASIMARSVGLWVKEYPTFCHVDVR